MLRSKLSRSVSGATMFVSLAVAALPALSEQPAALTHTVQPFAAVDRIEVPMVDRESALLEDELREIEGLPPRFAIPRAVSVTPFAGGTWEDLDGRTQLWRLRVESPGASSLNLGFTAYFMPEGGRLMIYSADYGQIVRPFTSADNAAHGQLWTPVVLSDSIIVELTIPAKAVDQLELELTSINVGYRGFGELAGPGLRSGSCNLDVICPEGDDWRLDIQAVGVISTGGSTFCTGFMVNNAENDLTPYFMTAEHCGVNSGNAASLVVYWNYENSTCRPPNSPASGGPGDGSLSTFQTGSFFRATYDPSDFTLVELDEDPDPAWEISYAGWDRSGVDATSAVAIHHPNTDEKRISFEDAPTSTTSYLGTSIPGDGTHVRVEDWDLGTTEPGSSGSPLFDQNHRVIGQLHGGYAACGNDDSDWYGKFALSWTGGGSASSRLSNWLDPNGSGVLAVDTISLNTLCSDAGEITLNRPKFACDGIAGIEVVDCGLNTNEAAIETVTVTLGSDSEPGGETVLLYETGPDTAKFQGTIELSVSDSAGVVQVAPGDLVTATYVDADDGLGGVNIVVTDTATVDCTPPTISNVQVADVQPRSATITFDASEPSLGTVFYGESCNALPGKDSSTAYATSVVVDVASLQDNTTYYFIVHAEDEAGNGNVDSNGGACYTFTTPEVPEYFTEGFGGDNDLDNVTILFEPNGSADFYSACAEPITELPTDPAGGTTLSLGDDSFASVTVPGGNSVSLYGVSYTTVRPSSNGYVTFTAGDDDYDETLEEHFGMPRIAALYDDLNPSTVGTVSWKQAGDPVDRVVVTWQNVPEYQTSNSNTFQIEMYFDGRIRISYLAIAAADGIAGLSGGGGLPVDFYESDLSAMDNCGPKPPTAQGANETTSVYTPMTITLQATDDGDPGPIEYVITQLPAHGLLTDPGFGPINSVPHTLAANGNQVEYAPYPCFGGADSLQFKANDGGSPPEGGDSNVATVSIDIETGAGSVDPIHTYSFSTNPGWSTQGAWAFGQPTGGGTHNGDPSSGFTGNNVYGYNLAGDYTNGMAVTQYLTTPALDCSELVGTELRFRRWLGVEGAPFDQASIQVSDDGANWTTVWQNGGAAISESSWSLQTLDISSLADGQGGVYIRWGIGPTDGGVTYPGWNLDDVEIWGTLVSPADFNNDSSVDLFDFSIVGVCFTGPESAMPADCGCADLDDDNDVDLEDFAGLQDAFNG